MSDTNAATTPSVPRLPIGNANLFRGIAENFSFHASPEAFIASRVRTWEQQTPSGLASRSPIRAKILNRNVAIISSHNQIRAILNAAEGEDGQPLPFIASRAYDELMTQFFPPPNLLLSDGPAHMEMRKVWEMQMQEFCAFSTGKVTDLVLSFFQAEVAFDTEVDLYGLMKNLSWRILLGSFLNLSPDLESGLFAQFQALQEDLLRGQFSLMPISIQTRIWQSPRSKGIAARKKLQDLIGTRTKSKVHTDDTGQRAGPESGGNNHRGEIPFSCIGVARGLTEVRDHLLMMTSSLAAKALASLLTAFFLNVFIFEHEGERLADKLRSRSDHEAMSERMTLLRSIYLETERLSPPIVGIMRRVTRDTVITGWNDEPETLLPGGWDAWMYFVGAGRDSAVFGQDCESFHPLRYEGSSVPGSVSFGSGPKSCLGQRFMQAVALLAVETCLANDIRIEGQIAKPGLKAWLGWETATPEQWAADIKQLPTQRPAAPVHVRFVRENNSS